MKDPASQGPQSELQNVSSTHIHILTPSRPGEDGRLYLVVFVFVGNLQGVHGSDHGLNGCEYVLVDQLGESFLVLLRVARTMNDSHLLDEGALAALARPYGEQRFKGF